MGDKSPYRYNPNFGYGLNGERKYSNQNSYHKPQLSLNHLWQINDVSSLSTAFYVSIGNGYGLSGQGYNSAYRNYWYGTTSRGILNTDYRNLDGTFAYDKFYEMNAESDHGSLVAMSKSINQHRWYGVLSTYTTKLNENWDIYGGIDFRYYKGIHTNELSDLYGGDYFIDSNSRGNVQVADNKAAAAGDLFVNQKLGIGDVVYRDYDGYVVSEGVFGQVEYSNDLITAFASGSISNISYWRYDRFYYDKEHAKSEVKNYLGFTVKGGGLIIT